MTPAGLEPAIPGSVGRCLIHWATGPLKTMIARFIKSLQLKMETDDFALWLNSLVVFRMSASDADSECRWCPASHEPPRCSADRHEFQGMLTCGHEQSPSCRLHIDVCTWILSSAWSFQTLMETVRQKDEGLQGWQESQKILSEISNLRSSQLLKPSRKEGHTN